MFLQALDVPQLQFLQIEEVNQKFPQMTLIRLKTQHFQTQKHL